MVGASGAISGVMGAYVVLFPHVRVYTLVPLGFFITTFALPAWVMLGYWMRAAALRRAGRRRERRGVRAHVGGFIAGVVLIKLFVRRDYLARHKAHHGGPARSAFRATAGADSSR